MNQTSLINEILFKEHSPVTSTTNIAEFVPYIRIAQELHIAPVIGAPLMEELKQQAYDDALTEANSELILKIAPALSFYAVYQALPFHWASIVNKGVTIRNSENSRGVNVKDIAQLRRWIKDDADTLKNQLIDFLNQHQEDYPLWRPQSKYCEKNASTGSSKKKFDSGFHFIRHK